MKTIAKQQRQKKQAKQEAEEKAPFLSKEIRRAVETGKVVFGAKQGEKILIKEKAELIVVSSNATKPVKEKIRHLSDIAGTPVLEFEGTGLELGSVCGKPFTVSVMAIQKAGKSKIMSAVK